jgi:DNA-directed RNA polymerase II subunit RPB1
MTTSSSGEAPLRSIVRIEYEMMTSDEVRRGSVLAVTAPVSWLRGERAPTPDGSLDPRLGAITTRIHCDTCGGQLKTKTNEAIATVFDHANYTCPGHMGYIELPVPVYTPVTLGVLFDVLRAFCYSCGAALLTPIRRRRTLALARRATSMLERIRLLKEAAGPMCYACTVMQPEYTLATGSSLAPDGTTGHEWYPLRASFAGRADLPKASPTPDAYKREPYVVTGARARVVLDTVCARTCDWLARETNAFDGSVERIRAFFDSLLLTALPVLPPCARPCIEHNGELKSMHDLTTKYDRILSATAKLAAFMASHGVPGPALPSFTYMSHYVREANSFSAQLQFYIDATIQQTATMTAPDGVPQQAFKQLTSLAASLKGKEGFFRQNLMGKRGNFSARSVITPDPNLPFDTIALPAVLATVLTIPERVTAANRYMLEALCEQRLVGDSYATLATRSIYDEHGLNGRVLAQYPYVRSRDGPLELGQIVERPLRDGDVVVFNRQPTLHMPSMQGVRVRFQRRKTIAFGVSKTKPFNADFDGDEMYDGGGAAPEPRRGAGL